MPSVRIEIGPRLHLGLISRHDGGSRRNGGIGFALQGPSAALEFTLADRFALDDHRDFGLGLSEAEQLKLVLHEVRSKHDLEHCMSVKIVGDMATHHGYGSGTAIRLACVEALFALNERPVSRANVVRLSGRGGTSGVGINTYFDGGFVFDLGLAAAGAVFAPSSRSASLGEPLKLLRCDMPEWNVGLCLPRRCTAKTQAEEVEFFGRTLPLPEAASYEAAYHAVFGVTAAVLSKDYAAFCRGIDRMQSTQWKSLERLEFGKELVDADTALRAVGADAVGMSSLGPLLVFFGDDATMSRVIDLSDAMDWDVRVTTPRNGGRTWQVL